MTIKERQRRVDDFEVFVDDAQAIFEKFAKADTSHQKVSEIFQFYISPGGRISVGKKSVEIFYGRRAVDQSQTIDENLELKVNMESEEGASLLYERTVDGKVVCLLYPARTETKQITEEALLLDLLDDPISLRKKVRCHWRDLVAFMHCTCVDGEPTHGQWLRTWIRRYLRDYFVKRDGRLVRRPARVKTMFRDVFKFGMTVGLSGFLIILVTWIESCGVEDRQQAQFEAMREQLSQASVRIEDVLTELQLQSQLMREQSGSSMTLPSTIESSEEKLQTLSIVTSRQDSIADELKEIHETLSASPQPKTEDSRE